MGQSNNGKNIFLNSRQELTKLKNTMINIIAIIFY